MKRLILLFLFAGFAADSVGAAAEAAHFDKIAGLHTERITRELSFAPDGLLRATTSNGSIKVSTRNQPGVLIHANKTMEVRDGGGLFGWLPGARHSFKTTQEAEAYFADLRLDVRTEGNTVEVKTIYPSHRSGVSLSVSYEISVPAKANLALRTSNGAVSVQEVNGSIEVVTSNGQINCDRAGGALQLRTSNGAIRCTDLTGAVTARTSNGAIEVRAKNAPAAGQTIDCHTSNGAIDLTLPESSAFSLSAGTSNGRIRSDFAITMEGELNPRHLEGKVGTGGGQVRLETSNGAITLNKAR